MTGELPAAPPSPTRLRLKAQVNHAVRLIQHHVVALVQHCGAGRRGRSGIGVSVCVCVCKRARARAGGVVDGTRKFVQGDAQEQSAGVAGLPGGRKTRRNWLGCIQTRLRDK